MKKFVVQGAIRKTFRAEVEATNEDEALYLASAYPDKYINGYNGGIIYVLQVDQNERS